MEELYLRQVIEPEKEKNLRSQIFQFKELTDKVSSKVKKQYEENPYPRWINLGLPLSPKPVSNIPKRANLRLVNSCITEIDTPKILVAGCGTGQHSISTASEIKNSQVLAIDLSLSSIAYAKRKTEELGISNIEYMQADILDLGGLNREFDIIESAGVLHHMDDPIAGWKVLVGCLSPAGLMKIGLYSTLARRHIAKVREEIRQFSIGETDKDMLAFRERLIHSSEEHHKAISLFKDFYSLSSYRDLVFHQQEHTFAIPEIQKCLDQLGLVFCGFESKEVVDSFKSKTTEENALYDLHEWSSYEDQNPNIFSGMYQFWCQKI
jgi:2-polyprenyl-3-methyl-5-hydroxy-6-metoxy-1,4-benzoquinol methylase